MNRFNTPVSSSRKYVNQYWTPNADLLAKALQNQQTNFDVAQEAGNIPIDALEGADTEFANELRKSLNSDIENLSNIYKTQGLQEGNRAQKELMRKVRRMQLPGGEAFELKNRKESFSKFLNEQQKRFTEGKISQAQYERSVTDAKKAYDLAGGYKTKTSLNLSPRQDQVSFDTFANTFLDNLKADGSIDGSFKYEPNTGQIYYDKTKVDEITAQKVYESLSSAYKNAASQTGQFSDEFSYRKNTGNLNMTDNRNEAQKLINSLETLDFSNKTQVKELQKKLNLLGFNAGDEDGIAGKKTKEAIEKINTYAALDDYGINQQNYTNFIDSYVGELAKPYAQAKAYKNIDKTIQNFGRTPEAEEKYAKAKKKGETFEIRLEGESIGFNPKTRPTSAKKLDETINTVASHIDNLSAELNSVTDPQRRKHINNQIKWNEAMLSKYEDIKQQSYNATSNKAHEKLNQLNQFQGEELIPEDILKNQAIYSLNPEQINFYIQASQDGTLVRNPDVPLEVDKAGFAIAEVFNKTGWDNNKVMSFVDDLTQLQQMSENSADEWIKNNADSFNQQMGTISLQKDEAEAVRRTLNTNSWTFFDETGPIENKETSKLFKNDEKPIISDNVEVSGITKGALGNFGTLVTLYDKNTGKTYYGAPSSGNIGEVIGNNIKETATPGTNQYVIGTMMSNPEISNIVGQLTDFNTGDTRKIVSGGNNLGVVKKSNVPSGVLFELTIPNRPDLFENAGETIPYNNELELSRDLDLINQQLKITTNGQSKSN